MNAYGTKEYRDRFEANKADTDGEPVDRETLRFGELEIRLTRYETQRKFLCETARMELFRDGAKIYECLCNEHILKPSLYRYEGELWLFFRKDLYGYTLLNPDTLEEHNYFPSEVLGGGEAFIPCEAAAIKDVLVLFGCYWACPCFYYLLSLTDYKTYNLADEAEDFGNCELYEQGVRIENGELKFRYGIRDEEKRKEKRKEAFFAYEELKKMLEKSRRYDL